MAARQVCTTARCKELAFLAATSFRLHRICSIAWSDMRDPVDMLAAGRARPINLNLHTDIVEPEETARAAPITNHEGIAGSVCVPLEGHLDPAGTTHACTKVGLRSSRRGWSAPRAPSGTIRSGPLCRLTLPPDCKALSSPRLTARDATIRDVAAVRRTVGINALQNVGKVSLDGTDLWTWLGCIMAGRIPKAGGGDGTVAATVAEGLMTGDFTLRCISDVQNERCASHDPQVMNYRFSINQLAGDIQVRD